MFTLIFDLKHKAPRIGAFCLLVALTGCAVPELPNLPLLSPKDAPIRAEHADITAGEKLIALRPPAGFCIDPALSRQKEQSAQIVVGDCRAAGREGPSAPIHAVMTANISAQGFPIPHGPQVLDRLRFLEMYLRSEEGRAALTRGSDTQPVIVLQSRVRADTLYILTQELELQPGEARSPRVWHGFSEQNGQMMVLSITSFDNYYAGDQIMLRYLIAFREAINRANQA